MAERPSADLEPFKFEHEGYTGNAGNTVDRWYHRAAVMLWPRARTFAIRAKANPAWGLREIGKALARGAIDKARAQLREMLPFWDDVAHREQSPQFVDQLLRVAVAIDDAKLAAALVDPVEMEQVTPRSAARCADLLERYGLTWCGQVFERWTARHPRGYGHEHRAALDRLAAGLARPVLREQGQGRDRTRTPDRSSSARASHGSCARPTSSSSNGRSPASAVPTFTRRSRRTSSPSRT